MSSRQPEPPVLSPSGSSLAEENGLTPTSRSSTPGTPNLYPPPVRQRAVLGGSSHISHVLSYKVYDLVGHFVLASQGLLGHCTFVIVMEIMS